MDRKNRVRQVVVDAWTETMGIQTAEPDSDFFALGGNCLMAVAFIERVEEELEIEFPLPSAAARPRATLVIMTLLYRQSARLSGWTYRHITLKAGKSYWTVPGITA